MKRKNTYLLSSAIVSTIFVCGITSISKAQGRLENVGIIFRNGKSLNSQIVNVIKYVGTCPGMNKDSISGVFRHKELSSAKDRRVRITNDTLEDVSVNVPYTDRKYRKNNRSEKIRFDFGNNHRGSKFVIKPGQNKLSYTIYEGKFGRDNMQVIRKGSFSINVEENVIKSQRDIEWKNEPELVCIDKNGSTQIAGKTLDKCKKLGIRKVGNCAGRTVYDDLVIVWTKPRYYKK
ncbi:MAG: hypothetical protein AAF063_07745 [Cyanobacteria bacterium J06643_5]